MKTAAILLAAMIAAPSGTAAATQSSEDSRPARTQPAKVKITRRGEIQLNKRIVSFERLTAELTRLKAVKGAVWYYREQPEKEPSAEAERTADAVIKKIIELKLPVRLWREDFE